MTKMIFRKARVHEILRKLHARHENDYTKVVIHYHCLQSWSRHGIIFPPPIGHAGDYVLRRGEIKRGIVPVTTARVRRLVSSDVHSHSTTPLPSLKISSTAAAVELASASQQTNSLWRRCVARNPLTPLDTPRS